MSWVATATIGSAIVGGVATRNASRNQQQSGDAAIAQQRESDAIAREDLRPFRQAGVGAAGQLSDSVSGPSASQPYLDAFNNNRTDPNLNSAEQRLFDSTFDQNNPLQAFVAGGANPRGVDQFRSAVNSPSAYQDYIKTGADPQTLQALQGLTRSGPETEFERKEGFDSLLSAARATGKSAAGGTFRDLAQYNDALNERNRGTRINELQSLIGIESGLRGQRSGELLTGEQQRLGNIRDLIGIEDGARSSRLQELLTGRQQGLNELGVAGSLSRGNTDRVQNDLLARLDVNQNADNTQFNRLYDVAGLGANAAAQTAQGTRQTGDNIGNIRVGQGNSAAAAQIGYGNIANNTIFDLIKLKESKPAPPRVNLGVPT